jgi:hypothetical protein
VDKNSSMTPTTSQQDDDVKEAMAALKGLLGLGGGDSTLAASASKTEDSQVNNPTPAEKQQQKSLPPKHNKKRNKKKQNTNNTLDNNNNNYNSSEAKPKKQGTPSQSTDSIKRDKKGKNKKKSGPENYAWSAFQSSPDASKLPIPAFSPASEKESVATTTKVEPTEVLVSESNVTSKEDESKVEEEVSQRSVEETETVVSKTGVNLAAALAHKNNDSSHLDSAPVPSASSNVAQQPLPGANFSFPMQSTYQNSNSPSLNPQRPPMPMLHPHLDAYGPPPPPGYVTIHVQVPAVLLPGNTMIVTSPYGYPVPVVVPEGIPPHSIIPVHVPAPPHLMHPPPPPYNDQHRYPHPHG